MKKSINILIMRNSITPDIVIVMCDIARAAIHALSDLGSSVSTSTHQIPQRSKCLHEIGRFREPVVHFRVDVDGVFPSPGTLFSPFIWLKGDGNIHLPWRRVVIIPDAL